MYSTPENNWTYLRSQIEQLKIGTSPLSLNTFLCLPPNTHLDCSRLTNLKFLCDYVAENETAPTQCALIMYGAMYFFYQLHNSWTAWAMGGNFGTCLASFCQPMTTDDIKVALNAFQGFVTKHENDLFGRTDDNMQYILGRTTSLSMCVKEIAALKEAAETPSFIAQVWNG